MPGQNRSAIRRSEISVVLYLAFLGVLMAFGVDVSLPAFDELREEFALDDRGVSVGIVGTLYILGTAAGQLVYGTASDRFGRRNVMLFGIGLYAIGALGSALAPNLEVLLISRLVWGLGAAAPYVLRLAIARDLYDGDQMARVVTIVMAVFLIGPIFVPIVGEAILAVGPWQSVFFASLVLAVAALAWTVGFGETLDPEDRAPLDPASTWRATRAIVSTRPTIGNILALTLTGVPFFVFLGSAQPIIDRIYDRPEQFAYLFAASGVFMALSLLVSNRLIPKYGARSMALWASVGFVFVAAAGMVMVLSTDGVPSIWWWFAWAAIGNSLSMVMTPMCSALALDPMGDMAGSASAVLGFTSLAGGALLAAIVDNQIDSTVTPMVVASLVYGALGLA
ncbi:MAG: multidrug effflux MFS transporter, partial [Acidimicrobiales bacterium]